MTQKTISMGFLIFPGFPMACLTSMVEPLRAANEISGERAFEWRIIAEQDSKIASSAEVEFDPRETLASVTGLDFLILLSAPTARFELPATPGQLRSLSRHGTTLGGVSGGVFPLLRAGLGATRKLAVHWCYRAAFDAEFPDAVPSDQVIEMDGNLVTAAGAAAAFDVALHLIEQRLGPAVATEVACWFQHPMMRREGVAQTVPSQKTTPQGRPLPQLLAEAVEIFMRNLAEPVAIGDVADELSVSPRHLERVFKQVTALSPVQYYRKLRMEAARQIVLFTNDRIGDVAGAVGYASLQSFSLYYEASFGLSPLEDRKRINLYRVEGNRPLPLA